MDLAEDDYRFVKDGARVEAGTEKKEDSASKENLRDRIEMWKAKMRQKGEVKKVGTLDSARLDPESEPEDSTTTAAPTVLSSRDDSSNSSIIPTTAATDTIVVARISGNIMNVAYCGD